MAANVLLYWPNIIGYVRFCIVLASWATFDTPTQFIGLYSLFIALDGVDGWLARKLSQCSRFGAWLDVVVDNLGRGMLWNMLFNWGWLVPALEWCVFVCNHSARGDHWKSSFTVSPLVRAGHHGERVSDTTGHVGSERAALPPTVAVCVSLWVPPAFLYSSPGDPAAGWRPPAGSVRRDVVCMDACLLPDQ